MRLSRRLFYKPKHSKKTTSDCSIYRILAPSVIGIFICAICLCGASWAWFTASTTTGTTTIQSSSYKLLYQVNEDTAPTELAEKGTAYTLTEDTTKITLKATGTAGATGYCSIKIGDETYYTERIFVDGTFTFTVNAAAGKTITLTPKWGTYSHDATLHNGDVITATGSQQSNTQAPDNTGTIEPSAEPTVPTTPTAPTTPGSAPAESKTTAPEPSATAPTPTEPKPTDTEPTPAPEDTTTPANTDKTE